MSEIRQKRRREREVKTTSKNKKLLTRKQKGKKRDAKEEPVKEGEEKDFSLTPAKNGKIRNHVRVQREGREKRVRDQVICKTYPRIEKKGMNIHYVRY